jgi:hypothetical protein
MASSSPAFALNGYELIEFWFYRFVFSGFPQCQRFYASRELFSSEKKPELQRAQQEFAMTPDSPRFSGKRRLEAILFCALEPA